MVFCADALAAEKQWLERLKRLYIHIIFGNSQIARLRGPYVIGVGLHILRKAFSRVTEVLLLDIESDGRAVCLSRAQSASEPQLRLRAAIAAKPQSRHVNMAARVRRACPIGVDFLVDWCCWDRSPS